MFPAFMGPHPEGHLHKGTPLGAFGCADEVHAALSRSMVALASVAADAAANNVLPVGGAATVLGHYMVQIQFATIKGFPAVLAGILVALVNVVSGELDLLARHTIVDHQQDDTRYSDTKGYGPDGFRMWFGTRKVRPFAEGEGAKVIVVTVENHLCMALKEQAHGASDRADIHRLPEAV